MNEKNKTILISVIISIAISVSINGISMFYIENKLNENYNTTNSEIQSLGSGYGELLADKHVITPYTIACMIKRNDPVSNIYAKNCSFFQITSYLNQHNMTIINQSFYDDVQATGNENVGLIGIGEYDAYPAFFTLKFSNGTQLFWGNWNGSSINDLYDKTTAIVCNHKCQNGDLP